MSQGGPDNTWHKSNSHKDTKTHDNHACLKEDQIILGTNPIVIKTPRPTYKPCITQGGPGKSQDIKSTSHLKWEDTEFHKHKESQ